MTRPTLTGSASLHLRMWAFGGLFTVLHTVFTPVVALGVAIGATFILAGL